VIHVRNGDFGVIMGEGGGPPHFVVDPVFWRRTADDVILENGGLSNLAGGTPPQADMVSGWTTPPPGPDGFYLNIEWNPVGHVSTFYRQSDSDGTPTSATPPSDLRLFALARANSGTEFGVLAYCFRTDASIIYDAAVHVVEPPDQQFVLGNTQLAANANFLADLAGTSGHDLQIGFTATGPDESYWALYAFGLRYPVIPDVQPPLRQWPRDDGLRRNPVRTQPTSRQGSLRRGPRGTYT
jgi:hypothetical protein